MMDEVTSIPEATYEKIGTADNFYIWSKEHGWDMTRCEDAAPFTSGLRLQTITGDIYLDPNKSALIIVDMQNYSLSESLWGPVQPQMDKAIAAIIKSAIPAARANGIQVIWLNWGLTEDELASMPPNILRAFSWRLPDEASESAEHHDSDFQKTEKPAETPRLAGMGQSLGQVKDRNGNLIDGGGVLMRDTWNADIDEGLKDLYEEGRMLKVPDVIIHKNRNSEIPNKDSPLSRFLTEKGIRTLLFTGMNIDQCVMSTIIDAQAMGYDPVMLSDGCTTDSPNCAQESAQWNCRKQLGFLSSCEAFAAAKMVGS